MSESRGILRLVEISSKIFCGASSPGAGMWAVFFGFGFFGAVFVFFLNDTATTAIYTLSLHDALPISGWSITGGYYRNWFGNFLVTDNTLVTPADYDPYCVTAPTDSRLPNGGGYQVCGLYDIKPVKRSEEHTSELQSHHDLVCRLLLEK